MDKTAEYFINGATDAIATLSNANADIKDRIRNLITNAYELGMLDGELKAKEKYLQDLQDISKDDVFGGIHESH